MIINQYLDVYLDSFGVPPRVYMVQDDTGRVLHLTPKDHQIPDGATATVEIKRSNGTHFSIPALSIVGNTASFNATQMLTTPGIVFAMLQIVSSGDSVKSFAFIVDVQKSSSGVPETPEQGKAFEDYIEEAKAEVANAAAEANRSETAATAAEGFSEEAQNSAAAALDSANDAHNSALEAASQAASAVETAVAPLQQRILKVESVNTRQQIEIDMNTAFRKDKYSIEVEDSSVAYTKDVPSGALPWAEVKKIGGKSVVWNQLIHFDAFYMQNSDASESDGIVTLQPFANNGRVYWNIKCVNNHKYFRSIKVKCEKKSVFFTWFGAYSTINTKVNEWETIKSIVNHTYADYVAWQITLNYNDASENIVDVLAKECYVVDLTQMFGAGNEPTSVDDERIKMIEAYAESHPEYNEGEIISAEVSEVVSRGANLISEIVSGYVSTTDGSFVNSPNWKRTDFIKAKPNKTYYLTTKKEELSGSYGYLICYDGGKNFIGFVEREVFGVRGEAKSTTLPNTAYVAMYFSSGWEEEKCFSEYPAYKDKYSKSKDFPSEVASQMHGINSEVFDKVNLMPTVYPNMKEIDLGTLNWTMTSGNFYVDNVVSDRASNAFALNNRYYQTSEDGITGVSSLKNDKSFCFQSNVVGRIIIRDTSFSDAQTFKASLSGVILHYESVSGGEQYEAVVMEKKTGEYTFTSEEPMNLYQLADVTRTHIQLGGIVRDMMDWQTGLHDINEFGVPMEYSYSLNTPHYYIQDKTLYLFTNLTTLEEVRNFVSGKTMIFELVNPKILDVSEYFEDENYRFLEVEGGGTITFKQSGDYKLAIPSVVEYDVKVVD